MYVLPEVRGRGYGKLILAALERQAVGEGHCFARLETGSYLPTAIEFYRDAGCRLIPTCGEYVSNLFSVCFEKRIVL